MCSSTSVHFKQEHLSLWIGDNKIYNAFTPTIKNAYYENTARKVISDRYQWENEQFDTIDWTALSKATKIMGTPTLIRTSKTITKTLPVGRTMESRTVWREPHCPRCDEPIETCRHICQCPHPESRTIMGRSIQRLSNWLESVNTEQQLHTELISIISTWTSASPLPSTSTLPPISSQLEGRLHRSFSSYMDSHYKKINSKMKGLTWSSIFIQKLWTCIFNEQWECRNKIVHGMENSTKITREHQNLNFDIRQYYTQESSNDLLYSDRHLLERPITEVLRKPTAVKRAWLEDMNLAIIS